MSRQWAGHKHLKPLIATLDKTGDKTSITLVDFEADQAKPENERQYALDGTGEIPGLVNSYKPPTIEMITVRRRDNNAEITVPASEFGADQTLPVADRAYKRRAGRSRSA